MTTTLLLQKFKLLHEINDIRIIIVTKTFSFQSVAVPNFSAKELEAKFCEICVIIKCSNKKFFNGNNIFMYSKIEF